MFDTREFFKRYNRNYHQFRAIYLKDILDNLEKYEPLFFTNPLDEEQRVQFKRTIQLDLRQNLFHAIETFFEIFFAVSPHNKKSLSDVNLMYEMSTSAWQKNYSEIRKIANGDGRLNWLEETFKVMGHEITKGHWIFYPGTFDKKHFDESFRSHVSESINALKYLIKVLAIEFDFREEYNAIKHGIRSIPVLDSVTMRSKETSHVFETKEGLTFFHRDRSMPRDEIFVETMVFDSKRDFELSRLTSLMISYMIFYRSIFLERNRETVNKENVAIRFFDLEEIIKLSERNVPLSRIKEKRKIKFSGI